ncbi:putative CDP-diacylglycerol-glycerol-3-phosphate 3-phosphatidyltransferase [Lyophyllum shimeji]|uniref:CDP-diacylglycerol--glycerol-3-phosphate 3-phosphatidyltransferase n=1 Tax=Lyophyllum shimeji TaxID=47721 RepID=A0A9P3UMM9_LYOSH|nr:putative CDP-diacylglycerol-glycerol-3-phosphate 3-phosphatidyltransferase [Lyophyllum shimeji]
MIHPSVREVTRGLAQKHPVFRVSSSKISVLNEPRQFYALLLDMIRRAEYRIFISSLYIGSSETELIDAIYYALSEKPSLQVYFQLDLNRSTRPGASSTAKILLPLISRFPERVHVSLFRSPHLRGVLAKLVPPRFNEGWGTWHAKIYGVDDEVIISGANLNQSYFTNRQDRYIHFKAQPHLVQYCFDFLRTVSTFSYKLSLPSATLEPNSYRHEGYVLHWPDSQTHPHHIQQKAGGALSAFQASWHTSHKLPALQDENDAGRPDSPEDDSVLLFPVIQAGQFNIREEESALALLYRQLDEHSKRAKKEGNPRPLVDLTTGYFGLYKPYRDLILASDVDTRIVAASPKANGFYGSKGISGRIPEGYTLLEQRFMRAVQKAGRMWDAPADCVHGKGVQLSEWERDGWTYHAKGIWVSPSHSSPPVLTLFGSTNLNSRSAHIDTELSFIMVVPFAQDTVRPVDAGAQPTKDPSHAPSTVALRHQLAGEVSQLRSYATRWKGAQRRVRYWTRVIVKMVEGML